ncbi:DNA gyrase subunit A [Cardinium endosymbiont of Bemisia tabaci]|uniref:DNA gyrase subunit A n=1 Tax=Cardinium endosymbiont of Bemisia tabaci TaxID=672794 RepID=UPI000442D081|nr:DNA gyrase subunit A [Cardinium endosymbiont of Bemisia tabaci]CDG50031.1 DNA gyrase subunit A [Cardinium endosymbiont cBtQ1 of Bemisia tabaci]
MEPTPADRIIPINIEDEMRDAYIDYSMSVIVARALPDVRDGLKPVHRRVLYGMYELGLSQTKAYKKSARIVGEVLGKYHPHGDVPVYETLARMAQSWALRYPLIEGQGNFGSIDGDAPAAMRYTEARLVRIAEELIKEINKKTVDFQLNFDASLEEPVVLPAKLPNLLLNGASGIAVGMATNMAPHNLSETLTAIVAYIEDHDITIPALMEYMIAPDFPTGGIIYGYSGVREAFETGRGRILLRGKATVEVSANGKEQIIVTEIPYQVNKAVMIERTAQLVNEKKIEGIADIRDESDKEGMRIVYDLKRDAIAHVVLNNLYKQTQLQSSFSVNNVALVGARPKILNLKALIVHFVDHRHEVLVRKTTFDLEHAKKKIHLLEGYLIALDHLDKVIALIRSSKDAEIAKSALMEAFPLSALQVKAILEMRLQRLTGLERAKIIEEYHQVQKLIDHLLAVLADKPLRMQLIKEELIELKERYGDARRTIVEYEADAFTMEDMIPDTEMVIMISNQGYIKRTPLVDYRLQGRGGVGAKGITTKKDDCTAHLFIATTHQYLLIFTEFGKIYWVKVYTIPETKKATQGKAIQNLINITPGDQVRSIIQVRDLKDQTYVDQHYVVMSTRQGIIKKTPLRAYATPRANGIHAIVIRAGDSLLDVQLTNGAHHIVLALASGRATQFNEQDVRPMGRVASGIRGITLAHEQDRVIGMACFPTSDWDVLVVSENGYGKRSSLLDYRITKRGGKGVKTMQITEKTGKLVAIHAVKNQDELMIMNQAGLAIRIQVSTLPLIGRATQGVRLIRLGQEDKVVSVARIDMLDEVDGPDHKVRSGVVEMGIAEPLGGQVIEEDLVLREEIEGLDDPIEG